MWKDTNIVSRASLIAENNGLETHSKMCAVLRAMQHHADNTNDITDIQVPPKYSWECGFCRSNLVLDREEAAVGRSMRTGGRDDVCLKAIC